MKGFVKKAGEVIMIIFLLLAAVIAHELGVFVAGYVIPLPVAVGMLFGFGLGWVWFSKR
jgi:hypothetical protein